MADTLYSFQVEHIFARTLFDTDVNPDIAEFLTDNGYRENARGNQIALFKNADVVAKLQAAGATDPLASVLKEKNSGWGITVTVYLYPDIER